MGPNFAAFLLGFLGVVLIALSLVVHGLRGDELKSREPDLKSIEYLRRGFVGLFFAGIALVFIFVARMILVASGLAS